MIYNKLKELKLIDTDLIELFRYSVEDITIEILLLQLIRIQRELLESKE